MYQINEFNGSFDTEGTPFGLFRKKNNFVKCYIWGMIYIGNLILRTMVFEYFNYSPYFKSYGRFTKNAKNIF